MKPSLKFFYITAIPLYMGLLSGCAYDYAPEENFGESVRQGIVAQTINPKGVGHDRIEPGLEGSAAKANVDRYIKSFEQPQSLGSVLRLGVGNQPIETPIGSK